MTRYYVCRAATPLFAFDADGLGSPSPPDVITPTFSDWPYAADKRAKFIAQYSGGDAWQQYMRQLTEKWLRSGIRRWESSIRATKIPADALAKAVGYRDTLIAELDALPDREFPERPLPASYGRWAASFGGEVLTEAELRAIWHRQDIGRAEESTSNEAKWAGRMNVFERMRHWQPGQR